MVGARTTTIGELATVKNYSRNSHQAPFLFTAITASIVGHFGCHNFNTPVVKKKTRRSIIITESFYYLDFIDPFQFLLDLSICNTICNISGSSKQMDRKIDFFSFGFSLISKLIVKSLSYVAKYIFWPTSFYGLS